MDRYRNYWEPADMTYLGFRASGRLWQGLELRLMKR